MQTTASFVRVIARPADPPTNRAFRAPDGLIDRAEDIRVAMVDGDRARPGNMNAQLTPHHSAVPAAVRILKPDIHRLDPRCKVRQARRQTISHMGVDRIAVIDVEAADRRVHGEAPKKEDVAELA